MRKEAFTFLVCSTVGHFEQTYYFTRPEADEMFDKLSAAVEKSPEGEYVAFYCASVGGLVNSYRKAH